MAQGTKEGLASSRRTRLTVGFLVLGLLLLVAFWLERPGSEGRWYSIFPPVLAVVLAYATQNLYLSLGSAVFLGSLLSTASGAGPWRALELVWAALSSWDNIKILAFVVFVLGMISVLIAGGGLRAVVEALQTWVKGRRSAQVVTVLIGFLVFIDDYANTMIVGSTMRPLTDRYRVSREKLAFLVDATSAPVAGVAVVSTWIGYEVGLFQDLSTRLGFGVDGYAVFFDVIGFRFYCFFMMAFVLLNALTGWDFGPMKKAELRAADGELMASHGRSLTSKTFQVADAHQGVRLSVWTAIGPLAVMMLMVFAGLWWDGGGTLRSALDVFSFAAWREVIGRATQSALILAGAAALTWLLALAVTVFWARLPLAVARRASFTGFRGALLPVVILVLAWALKGVCDDLKTAQFIVETIGQKLPNWIFPAVVFLVAGATAFATGTSWGTMAILLPTLVPVAFVMDGSAYGAITMMVMAAVLDGAILGDHCSPISDTTIMSSIASSCDHLHHVSTQLPYSLVVGGLAVLMGYLPVALGWPLLASFILGGLGVFLALYIGNRLAASR